MSEERILVFSKVYPEWHPMRYLVIDKQFLKTCTDVCEWIPLSEEVFTRPDSNPEQNCKSLCKLFAEAKLKEEFWQERCEICKEEAVIARKPYKWEYYHEFVKNYGDDFPTRERVFSAARERKEG